MLISQYFEKSVSAQPPAFVNYTESKVGVVPGTNQYRFDPDDQTGTCNEPLCAKGSFDVNTAGTWTAVSHIYYDGTYDRKTKTIVVPSGGGVEDEEVIASYQPPGPHQVLEYIYECKIYNSTHSDSEGGGFFAFVFL